MRVCIQVPIMSFTLAYCQAAAGPRIDAAHWQRDQIPPEAPPVLVDAVSLGIPGDGKGKPFVRHVIVKERACAIDNRK